MVRLDLKKKKKMPHLHYGEKVAGYVLVAIATFATFLSYRECIASKSDLKGGIKLSLRIGEILTLGEMDEISNRIYGPDVYGKGCHPSCGCPKTKVDCPRHYSVEDVEKSGVAVLSTSSKIHYEALLEAQHAEAINQCLSSPNLERGGWCLSRRSIKSNLTYVDGRVISIPSAHVPPSERIGIAMEELFRTENVTSVSDFGAGVGQYGVYLKSRIPYLVYNGYDGAGDIESFTSGVIKYVDLTVPLDLPVTEWIVSLEVGEHIPSKFEGMYLRNIHRHNCKGVILSWGILGQGGENHINNHSNEYITQIFNDLGYNRDLVLESKFRIPDMNYGWFVHSTMVFRRRKNTCDS